MKKFIKYNPNLKKNWNNKFFLNLAKFSFSIKSSQTELIENEIMKSFSRITKIYNISDQVKKNKEIYTE